MITLQFLVFIVGFALFVTAQQQDPFAINGGSILAMAGKDSVAIAVDKRFGSGPQVYAPTLDGYENLVSLRSSKRLQLFCSF